MTKFVKVINNKVIQIIVANQEHINMLKDKDFYMEDDGTKFNKAGIGFAYDAVRYAFIPPKPHSSWTLNEETCLWQAPIAKPNVIEVNEKRLALEVWSEELQTWKAYAADDQTEDVWNTSSNVYEAS